MDLLDKKVRMDSLEELAQPEQLVQRVPSALLAGKDLRDTPDLLAQRDTPERPDRLDIVEL